jgi:hypothetical protein
MYVPNKNQCRAVEYHVLELFETPILLSTDALYGQTKSKYNQASAEHGSAKLNCIQPYSV